MVQQYLSTVSDYSDVLVRFATDNFPSQSQGTSPKRRRNITARDSEARFGRIGRPGSKRFQRYINKSFLQDRQLDLEPEDFQVSRLSTSPFSLLFEEEVARKWAPFVDITEEQQDYLLEAMTMTHKEEEQEDELGDFVIIPREGETIVEETEQFVPEAHFRRVDRKIRAFIKKNPNNPFVLSMDQEILKYIGASTLQPKQFSFDEAFQRMICHGICQYYRLHSHSRNEKSGNRVVMVRRPSEGFLSPTITLSIFLKTL